jgi:hypothetical protein
MVVIGQEAVVRELDVFGWAGRGVIVVALGFALAACERPTAPETSANAAGPAVGIKPISAAGGEMRAQQSLVFFDSEAFDDNLGQAMKDRTEEVHVRFAGPTSLNTFPARINIWLAEVKHSDGAVVAVDPSQPAGQPTRGLGIGIVFDLIDLLTGMETRQEAADRLALSHAYDARIVYDAMTGNAREVVFIRRGAGSST